VRTELTGKLVLKHSSVQKQRMCRGGGGGNTLKCHYIRINAAITLVITVT